MESEWIRYSGGEALRMNTPFALLCTSFFGVGHIAELDFGIYDKLGTKYVSVELGFW